MFPASSGDAAGFQDNTELTDSAHENKKMGSQAWQKNPGGRVRISPKWVMFHFEARLE